MPAPTFHATIHGPLLWARLGWPWDARARALAQTFDGWTGERLAGVLGLPAGEVRRLLYGGVLAADTAGHNAPSSHAVPSVGDLFVTARALWLQPRRGGGFSARLTACSGAAKTPAGSGAEVLALQSGAVLLRLMQVGEADKLAWLGVPTFGPLRQESMRA